MSKVTKLFTQPKLFFQDLHKKKLTQSSVISPPEKKALPKNKENQVIPKKTPPAPKTPAKISAPPQKVNPGIIIDHMRLFTKVIHLLHTGEGVNSAYQLEQWVGEFIESG